MKVLEKIKKVSIDVPGQNNHCDCGLFLLNYAEVFTNNGGLNNCALDEEKYKDVPNFESGSSNFSDVALKARLPDEWTMDMNTKRNKIHELIDELQEAYAIRLSTEASTQKLAVCVSAR